MIAEGIKINWDHAIEYIRIDFDNLDRLESVDSSLEYWKNEKEWVSYKTSSYVKKISNDEVVLVIKYSHKDNVNLNKKEIPWGESEIKINKNKDSGTVIWTGEESKDGNGQSEWKRIKNSHKIKKSSVKTNKTEREAGFRDAVLAVDGQCVISSQRNKDILEAAHIIPSSKGGNEIIDNGITLRIDLHRLFDRKYFYFDDNGKLIKLKDLPEGYSDIEGKLLPRATIDRIKNSLAAIRKRT